MKKLVYILYIGLFFMSCDHEENYILPDFLDGTQYGIFLEVNHATDKTINKEANTKVEFTVGYKGDDRPVESIEIYKKYGSVDENVQFLVLTSFPQEVSINLESLVQGFSNLSLEDIEKGDQFHISFRINYVDGGVVTRFGTRINPNFNITIN